MVTHKTSTHQPAARNNAPITPPPRSSHTVRPAAHNHNARPLRPCSLQQPVSHVQGGCLHACKQASKHAAHATRAQLCSQHVTVCVHHHAAWQACLLHMRACCDEEKPCHVVCMLCVRNVLRTGKVGCSETCLTAGPLVPSRRSTRALACHDWKAMPCRVHAACPFYMSQVASLHASPRPATFTYGPIPAICQK